MHFYAFFVPLDRLEQIYILSVGSIAISIWKLVVLKYVNVVISLEIINVCFATRLYS